MKRLVSLALFATLGTAAFAQNYIVSGSLTTSDPRFSRPSSMTSLSTNTATAYDAYPFVVSTSGIYTGELSASSPLDGYLLVYASAFNPATPLLNLLNADDDYSGAFTILPGSSSGSARGARITATAGQNNYVNGAGLNLTAGITYYAVVTSFANATASSGTGNYSLGLGGGPGAVTPPVPVPEPATLGALGFGALALMKRRRRA